VLIRWDDLVEQSGGNRNLILGSSGRIIRRRMEGFSPLTWAISLTNFKKLTVAPSILFKNYPLNLIVTNSQSLPPLF